MDIHLKNAVDAVKSIKSQETVSQETVNAAQILIASQAAGGITASVLVLALTQQGIRSSVTEVSNFRSLVHAESCGLFGHRFSNRLYETTRRGHLMRKDLSADESLARQTLASALVSTGKAPVTVRAVQTARQTPEGESLVSAALAAFKAAYAAQPAPAVPTAQGKPAAQSTTAAALVVERWGCRPR